MKHFEWLFLAGLFGCVVGCTTVLPPVTPQKVAAFQQTLSERVLASSRHLLKENEFVVPNKVMCAYAQAIIPDNSISYNASDRECPGGGYIISKFSLSTPNQIDVFTERMEYFGFTPEEIALYSTIFKPGNIILNAQRTASENSLVRSLKHERVHQELKKLPASAYHRLKAVAKDLTHRKYTLEQARESGYFSEQDLFGMEKDEVEKGLKYKISLVASDKDIFFDNFEELYASLITQRLTDGAEKALKKEYPDVYETVELIRQRVDQPETYQPTKPWDKQSQSFEIKENTTAVPTIFCPDKPVLLGSRYCASCKPALENLTQAAAGLGIEIEYVDQDDPASTRAQKLGLFTQIMPTLVHKCRVYSGFKSKEEYEQILE